MLKLFVASQDGASTAEYRDDTLLKNSALFQLGFEEVHAREELRVEESKEFLFLKIARISVPGVPGGFVVKNGDNNAGGGATGE